MPELENKKPRRPLKNLPPDRFQPKVFLFWLALFGLVLALLWWTPPMASSPANVSIHQVI